LPFFKSSIPEITSLDFYIVKSDAKFAVYVATNIKLKTYRPAVMIRPAAV
jgi:hypothetical protein